MAKEMNELEEMFAEMDIEQESLFDEMEEEESVESEFLDEEDQDAFDEAHDEIEFENEDDETDLDLEGVDENEEDDDFLELEESDEDDDDLFMLKESLRQPKLDEDDYLGTIGKVEAERVESGKYGPWVKITLPFIVKNPTTGEKVTVQFVANRSMDPKSRLYPILKGILGIAPSSGFNLKSVEGKKVKVSIEHRTDEKGNVWENIMAVRPFKKKR